MSGFFGGGGGGGGGGGAPTTAPYVTTAPDAGLSNEQVLGAAVIMRGTLASRPAAGVAGRLYYVTDAGSERWTRDNGSTWDDCGPDWDFVNGKPATFTPSVHTHTKSDITDFAHPHTKSDITDFAHKDSHKSGGGDAFTSTDVLEAVVKRLQEAGGPTILALGTVADGQFLRRSGTAIVGDTPAGGGGSGVSVFHRDMAAVDVVNTTTETSLYSHSIPGGTLGANGGVRVTVAGDYLNDSGSNRNFTVRVKLGATTVFVGASGASMSGNQNRRSWVLIVEVFNTGATNSQVWRAWFYIGAPDSTGFLLDQTSSSGKLLGVGVANSAEDTTAARTLDVTVQHSFAHASLSFRKTFAFMELLS